jgi:hypothetical protein
MRGFHAHFSGNLQYHTQQVRAEAGLAQAGAHGNVQNLGLVRHEVERAVGRKGVALPKSKYIKDFSLQAQPKLLRSPRVGKALGLQCDKGVYVVRAKPVENIFYLSHEKTLSES